MRRRYSNWYKVSESECYNIMEMKRHLRSVECENNSEAWTNLGVLYLIAGESQLANAAFKESQNCDPSYLNGWTGQSLLADAAEGHEEEAMDLFR